MPNKKPARSVIVAGDITMDWNIATSPGSKRPDPAWSPEINSSIFLEKGGAAHLAELIEAAASTLPTDQRFAVHQIKLPPGEISPSDKSYHHSFSMWSPFKYSEKTPGEKSAWRIEQFLGIDRSTRPGDQSMQEINEDLSAELVVLDDDGLGYRDQKVFGPRCCRQKISPHGS